jgi:hypothetical protein
MIPVAPTITPPGAIVVVIEIPGPGESGSTMLLGLLPVISSDWSASNILISRSSKNTGSGEGVNPCIFPALGGSNGSNSTQEKIFSSIVLLPKQSYSMMIR